MTNFTDSKRSCYTCKHSENRHGSTWTCNKCDIVCSKDTAKDCDFFDNGEWPIRWVDLVPYDVSLLICVGMPAERMQQYLGITDAPLEQDLLIRHVTIERHCKPIELLAIRFHDISECNTINYAIAASAVSMHLAKHIGIEAPDYHAKHQHMLKYVAQAIFDTKPETLIR